MKDLVEYLAKALVDEPDQVVVTESTAGSDLLLDIKVAPGDMGRMIGRGGRVINSVRTLVQVCAARDGQRVFVELVED